MAQSPRRLTPPEPGPAGPGVEPHAWHRHHRLWDAYYAAAGLLTLFQVWVNTEPVANRLVGAGLLGALGIWYAGFGRRLALGSDAPWPRPALFLAGALALLAVAASVAPASAFALFALVPQAHQVTRVTHRVLPAAVLTLLVLAAGYVPLAIRTGQVVGPVLAAALVLALALPSTVWISRVIAQSADRADLIDQLHASQAEVSRLSHEAGVAAERQRLAGDIHDTIAQGVSSVVMLVQAADAALDRDPPAARQHLQLAARTARENLAEARALVAALTPAPLEGSSLPAALQRLATRAGTRTTVAVTGGHRHLPTAMEVVLLRAAQESLTNVDKHAGAGQAQVTLAYERAGTVMLKVADDGCGFAPGKVDSGYGLAAMQARVEQVDGTVAVDSAPGAGTTVRVSVPVTELP